MLTVSSSTPTAQPRRAAGVRRVLFFATWVALVALGLAALLAYEMTPGNAASLPAEAAAAIVGSGTPDASAGTTPGYTLVMAAHPRCPCTRASVAELAVLMTHLQGRLTATVWFYTPPEETAGWARTGLWETAAALPGVTAKADPGGQTARRLGAETSGQVLLFDPAGRNLFAGGITGARGHEGDNAGLRAVESLVLGQTSGPVTTPVFGCSLLDAPDGGPRLAGNGFREADSR